MNSWIAAVCIAALGISLLQVVRQKTSGARRTASALLQIAIWGLVWLLVTPPALLPTNTTDTPQIELPQNRDALRDLPPTRLPTKTAIDAQTWQISWPQRLSLGEPLQLRIAQNSKTASRIFLEDPFGNTVDTAPLDPKSSETTLNHTPKLPGRWLYQLRFETESGGATSVRREPLPVEVLAPEPPTVLLWLARPGFESAALSRWLRQSGTPTRVITQLAPEVLRRESFNGVETQNRQLLDPEGPFDLLILDSRLWPRLDLSQRQNLAKLAENRSLLWLVNPDSPRGFLDYTRAQGMPLVALSAPKTDFPMADKAPPLALSGYGPQYARPTDIQLGTAPIYWARITPDQSLGFVLFGDSYRWTTSGFAAEYSRLWKTLFDHQLTYRGDHTPIALKTQLPLARQRVTLCSPAFVGTVPKLIPVNNEGVEAPLTGVALPGGNDTCYSWWPQKSGWHRVGPDSEAFHFYVFPSEAWPQWQQAIAHADTQQMASARLGPTKDKEVPRSQLPRNWIVLALILLLTFSWWRERSSLR
ncbi:hypothetical protein [Microbulbifer thermotolerans]|uniref:Uncharacterized protein n=1 Tax=Microbulbifer thermotolerans TaxID=252514 RepID=A0A143HIF2_MICTH|nr:hypothetical protein [Microbulbifer thermotolerans]AMX01271.1 hypothetical protein A3224_00575 [Microbulbifer thermotolerans]